MNSWKDKDGLHRARAYSRKVEEVVVKHGKSSYAAEIQSNENNPTFTDGVLHGNNDERLKAVKRLYDPENIFHINRNIKP